MSSVFTDYAKLQDALVAPTKKKVDSAPSGLLRVGIPVCVLLSEDPEERWGFVCFCMRWIVSDSATEAMRVGAMLSVLSAHASNMRSHVALAARCGDADINILEVESIDHQNQTIKFTGRSNVTDGRARQMYAIAQDLPPSFSNGSPFSNREIEDNYPTDMSELLNMVYSVATQIWVAAMKSMTAPDTSSESEGRRLAKYIQQNRVVRSTILAPATRGECTRIIRGSLVLRHFLITEIKRATSMGSNTTRYYATVGDAAAYFKNAGMAAFFLTLRFGIGTKYSTLAVSALSADMKKLQSLIRVYQSKGEDGPYMAFLEDSDLMSFAPGNYPLMYSYAMGVGSILEASIARYQFARSFMNDTFYRLGIETAQRNQGSLDETLAKELQLSGAERRAVQELVTSLDLAGEAPTTQRQPTFLSDQDYEDDPPARRQRMEDTRDDGESSQPPPTPGAGLTPYSDDASGLDI
uniref:Nucleocapsid n=1 Tax=avian paramyxovirus 6 TaxID=2560316 RepID=A0A8E5N7M6_9MONO|nr:nucleocapsid protein [Avian metaavulavirus 6]QUX37472.1 nucleocapsid protein [Avian metaavulavirus 6]